MTMKTATPKGAHSQSDLRNSQLFLDDYWIEDSIRVSRVFHQARKYRKPVIQPDRAYEGGCLGYGSAICRNDQIHIWYPVFNPEAKDKVCYAVSDDGLNFRKPDLGFYEWKGSCKNNICIMPEEPGVIDCIAVISDDQEPEWPLKAVYWQGIIGPRDSTGLWARRGLVAARSKDGLKWENTPGPFCHGWGDRTNALPTRDKGKFVVYTRQPANPYLSRVVYRIESEDMVTWSDPEIVLKQNVEDPPRYEPYSLQAFKAGDIYIGFVERMHTVPDRLDSEFVFSRDGLNWQRSRKREAFLPAGQSSDWDADWSCLMSSAPIVKNNRLWFYYGGRNTGGGPSHFAHFPFNDSAIGLAVLRIDGYASLQAVEAEGWLETPTFVWDGGDLAVNADPRRDLNSPLATATGEIRVEVCDAQGAVRPGFSREDCQPIADNTARQAGSFVAVTWQDATVKKLAGEKIRLRFHMRDAHLFAFKSLPS
jgi:hypothetical protein